MSRYNIHSLKELETETIYVIREAYAQFEKPCQLFSADKKSVVLLHLTRKAFYPAKNPIQLLHVDLGRDFPEVIEYRDMIAVKMGTQLVVANTSGQAESIDSHKEDVLFKVMGNYGFDAVMDASHPSGKSSQFFKDQSQPDNYTRDFELWNLLHGKKKSKARFRIFPMLNWSELDVWMYAYHEDIILPDLYFAHDRKVLIKDGLIQPLSPLAGYSEDELVLRRVRFNKVTDAVASEAVESNADSISAVILEMFAHRVASINHEDELKQ